MVTGPTEGYPAVANVRDGIRYGGGEFGWQWEGTLKVYRYLYMNLTGKVLWLKNNTGNNCKWVPNHYSHSEWWSKYVGGGGLTRLTV